MSEIKIKIGIMEKKITPEVDYNQEKLQKASEIQLSTRLDFDFCYNGMDKIASKFSYLWV